MAKATATSDWSRLLDLFAAASPEFVPALRECHDAPGLGRFAGVWLLDPRPAARQMLFDYLDQPLNALRHEPLVKRLFKLAEVAGDDALMARFLVAFDRSVRKVARTRQQVVGRSRVVEVTVLANRYKPAPKDRNTDRLLADPVRYHWFLRDRADRRLFTPKTRQYLRRRAWRYFRKLGRSHPARYLTAISAALTQYTDADTADGVALLDNWGLVHALFHFSPVLVAKPGGWRVAEGKSLAELAPAPMFAPLWRANPDMALNLVEAAESQAVRRWAMRWLRAESPAALDALPVEKLLGWLAGDKPDLAGFAADVLMNSAGLGDVAVDRWIEIAGKTPAESLDVVAALVAKWVPPDRATLAQAVALARQRPTPLARLGLGWLADKRSESAADDAAIQGLREASAETLRPALCAWAAAALSASPRFRPEWVLDFLDSRFADVRKSGWDWLHADRRATDSPVVWQRLLESPYDDLRLNMVARLDTLRESGAGLDLFDAAHIRLLWATVLLNAHGGGRAKPVVVNQLVDRLARTPADAPHLLPVLAAAVRSGRAPEFRTGLRAVVRLLDVAPELEDKVSAAFPELVREPALPA